MSSNPRRLVTFKLSGANVFFLNKLGEPKLKRTLVRHVSKYLYALPFSIIIRFSEQYKYDDKNREYGPPQDIVYRATACIEVDELYTSWRCSDWMSRTLVDVCLLRNFKSDISEFMLKYRGPKSPCFSSVCLWWRSRVEYSLRLS